MMTKNELQNGSVALVMKLSITLIGICLLLTTCKSKKDDPSPAEQSEQEKVTALLTGGAGTWAPASSGGITLEGIDVAEEFFSGFTIRFTATEIITTGTTPVWLRLDTWVFKQGSSTIIIRGQDSKEIAIESISETELRLTLEWNQTTFGGKTKSLPGRYQFVLNK